MFSQHLVWLKGNPIDLCGHAGLCVRARVCVCVWVGRPLCVWVCRPVCMWVCAGLCVYWVCRPVCVCEGAYADLCVCGCMEVNSESEVTQLCLTLCDPIDSSPPGSSVHGIFQARVLEWGATAFSITGHRDPFKTNPYHATPLFQSLQ